MCSLSGYFVTSKENIVLSNGPAFKCLIEASGYLYLKMKYYFSIIIILEYISLMISAFWDDTEILWYDEALKIVTRTSSNNGRVLPFIYSKYKYRT